VIDREINDAFDELFVGGDPPDSVEEAISQLPAELRHRIAVDDVARRTLAELVWMSKALRDSSPRPSSSFAGRTADAAFRTSTSLNSSWRKTIVGTLIAASVLFAVGVVVWRPKTDQQKHIEIVKVEPREPSAEPATLALLDQVKKYMPRIPSELPLGRMDVSLSPKAETTSLAAAIAAPAGKLAIVGKTIDKETKPIRDSVRDAFAFLGEFPSREKRSL
jgi:hypothetical protein